MSRAISPAVAATLRPFRCHKGATAGAVALPTRIVLSCLPPPFAPSRGSAAPLTQIAIMSSLKLRISLLAAPLLLAAAPFLLRAEPQPPQPGAKKPAPGAKASPQPAKAPARQAAAAPVSYHKQV